ncbi:MAG TPA: M50 family metallopeptidase, partial [Caulobacteraceae bacterium]|nr:M50 family metallopeptidase [Caulobacteraceae bacterium]
ALVVVAGPASNFLLSIALFALLFATLGEVVIQGPIDKVAPGSAAERAGFVRGDEIIAADGHKLRGFEDLQEYVVYRDGVPIDFTVKSIGTPSR